jgi:hypothetical protein
LRTRDWLLTGDMLDSFTEREIRIVAELGNVESRGAFPEIAARLTVRLAGGAIQGLVVMSSYSRIHLPVPVVVVVMLRGEILQWEMRRPVCSIDVAARHVFKRYTERIRSADHSVLVPRNSSGGLSWSVLLYTSAQSQVGMVHFDMDEEMHNASSTRAER